MENLDVDLVTLGINRYGYGLHLTSYLRAKPNMYQAQPPLSVMSFTARVFVISLMDKNHDEFKLEAEKRSLPKKDFYKKFANNNNYLRRFTRQKLFVIFRILRKSRNISDMVEQR